MPMTRSNTDMTAGLCSVSRDPHLLERTLHAVRGNEVTQDRHSDRARRDSDENSDGHGGLAGLVARRTRS